MSKKPEKPLFEHQIIGLDATSIKQSFVDRLTYSVAKDNITATERDWFFTAAYVARDRMIDRWMETMRNYYVNDAKRIYYFSMEFLMGRTLMNSLHNLGFDQQYRTALSDLGVDLDKVREVEQDAALGNGGLGLGGGGGGGKELCSLRPCVCASTEFSPHVKLFAAPAALARTRTKRTSLMD